MLEKIIAYLESHMAPCFYKKTLGVICPGCGMQRALIELLKGNILESIKIYPALIPSIGLFLFLILHLVFKFKNGAVLLKYLFIGDVILIFINYFYTILS